MSGSVSLTQVHARVIICASPCMQTRPSMTKFVCPHGNIEVVKVAKFMPGFLNRQIILLMDFLGVPVRVEILAVMW